MRRHWVFVIWAVILSGAWVLLNLPRDNSILGMPLGPRYAGFPWTFANVDLGKYDLKFLAADVGVGLAIIVTIAGIVAHSRPGR
jgi:hypothetical protein